MKNKLKVVSVLSAALVLAGCDGLVDNSGSTPSIVVPPSLSTPISGGSTAGNSTIPGPSVETVKMTTGESKAIPGAAVTVKSGDAEIIAIEQQTTKAVVRALTPGKVTLTNGTDSFEVTISYDVYGVASGSDYTFATTSNHENFRSETITPYQVGTKNAFKPDVTLTYTTWKYDETNNTYEADELEEIEITEAHKHLMNDETINYTFTLEDNSSAAELVTVNDDATISFKETAIGKSITLTIETSFTTDKVTQTYFINDGYNAYTHKDFKTLFEDNTITHINLLHNIKAEYDEDQMYFNTKYQRKVPYNTTAAGDEVKFQGSMYFRYGGVHYGTDYGTLQPLVVNGNYMLIDAQDLPERVAFIPSEEGSYDDIPGLVGTQAGAIKQGETTEPVVNPQEGLFRVHDFSDTNSDEPVFTVKDLQVIGDSNRGDLEHPTMNSGGSNGAILGGVNALFDNVNFKYLVSGAQVNFSTGVLKFKDSIIEETWGASVTTWEAKKLIIENTALRKAGAPSIWNIQSYGAASGTGSVVCDVNVDAKSEITNYLTPTSSWFQAYNLDITTYAVAIDNIMKRIGYTIYKPGTNQISFALLLQHPSDTSRNAGMRLTIGGQSAGLNPAQFTTQEISDEISTYNPIGAGIFAANNSILLALGQVIDYSIYDADPSKLQSNYMTQLATKLGTYRLSGEQHLYIEVAVKFGNELLSAVLEVTPVSTSN